MLVLKKKKKSRKKEHTIPDIEKYDKARVIKTVRNLNRREKWASGMEERVQKQAYMCMKTWHVINLAS